MQMILFCSGATFSSYSQILPVSDSEYKNLNAPQAFNVFSTMLITNEPLATQWLCDFVKKKKEIEPDHDYYLSGIARNLASNFERDRTVTILNAVRNCLDDVRHLRARQGADAVLIGIFSTNSPNQAIALAIENSHKLKNNYFLNVAVLSLLTRIEGQTNYSYLLTNYFSNAFLIEDGTKPKGYYAIIATDLSASSGNELFGLEQINLALQSSNTNLYPAYVASKVNVLEEMKRYKEAAQVLKKYNQEYSTIQSESSDFLKQKIKDYGNMGYIEGYQASGGDSKISPNSRASISKAVLIRYALGIISLGGIAAIMFLIKKFGHSGNLKK